MISSIWKGTLAILASALLVGSLAGAAVAAPTGPTGAPTADPAAFRLTVAGTYRYHGRGYVLPKASLDVRGATKADLAGQRVALEIYRSGKRVAVKRVELQEAGGKSVFHTSWRATRKGSYRLRIALSDEQQQVAERGHSVRITAVRTNIHRGSRGVAVRVFQHKLRSLHYVAPLNGRFDAATGRGFMAFRKVTGLSRNYSAGSSVTRKLAAGRGAFRLRYPGAGRHVEVSIRRQVMVFASGGKVTRIYHVSTGKPSTPTVRGTYRVYMKDGGTNAKGMVKSSYFTGGYAIHGYKDVPPYAASHGCVRVPVPSASSIFGWVHMGTRIDTYY